MAISQNLMENIQQMDISSGKPFVINKRKVLTNEKYCSLVIGLGGTGVDALLETKGYVAMTCRGDDADSMPDNVAYLAFETDERDEAKKSSRRTGNIGFDKQVNEFVKISNPHVGDLVDPTKRHLVPDTISSWIDFRLDPGGGKDGAAGKRQAGRLLLINQIDKIKTVLESAIRSLVEGKRGVQLKIYILSGVGGGTGSGTFLDMAYIVRRVAENIVSNPSVMGYIFLPDVNLTRKNLSDEVKTYIKCNGYAALKELDYWTNINEHKARFVQDYGSGINVNSNMPPFDFIHLISATDVDGTVLENGYETCISAAAQSILSFIAKEEISGDEGQFAMSSFYSNIDTCQKTFGKQFPDRNYKYVIIGAGSFDLPIDQIMMYVTHLLFGKMKALYDNSPSKEQVEQYVGQLGLNPQQLLFTLYPAANVPLTNIQQYTWQMVCSKNATVNLNHYVQTDYFNKATIGIDAASESFDNNFGKRFDTAMDNAFTDASKGPIYVNRVITNSAENAISLLSMIRSFISITEREISQLVINEDTYLNLVNAVFATAQDAMLNRGAKKDDYLNALNKYARNHMEIIAKRKMIDIYTAIRAQIIEKNDSLYSVVTGVLVELQQIFRKNADIIMDSKEVKKEGSGRTFTWETLNVPMIGDQLREMFDEKGDSQQMIESFVQTLLRKINEWTGKNADVSKFIRDYLGDNLGDIASKSLEYYVECAIENKSGAKIGIRDSVINNLAPNLVARSQPLLRLNSTVRVGSTIKMISVPAECTKIVSAFKDYQQSEGTDKFSVQESSIKNRIFMISAKCAVPMAAYADLYDFEYEYMNAVNEGRDDMIGRQLVSNQTTDWLKLPSPIPFRARPIGSAPKTIEKWEMEIRELFKKSLKYGCIKERPDNNYECIVTIPFDIQIYLNDNRYLTDGKLNGIKLREDLKSLTGYLNDGLTPVPPIPGGERILSGGTAASLDAICDKFSACFETCQLMRIEVKKYEDIERAISHVKELVEEIDSFNSDVKTFAQALMCGEIFRKPNSFVYCLKYEEQESEILNTVSFPAIAEYKVFEAFLALKNNQASRLKYQSVCANSKMKCDEMGNDIASALEMINPVSDIITKKMNVISNDYANGMTANGVTEEVYNFYALLKNFIDTQKNMFNM